MASIRTLLVGSVFLLAFDKGQGGGDGNFCSKVSDDWSTMKEKIESLESESEAVAQLNTNLQSLSSRMNDLEAKGRCVVTGFPRTRWPGDRTLGRVLRESGSGTMSSCIGRASLARENEAGGSWGQQVHILHVNTSKRVHVL